MIDVEKIGAKLGISWDQIEIFLLGAMQAVLAIELRKALKMANATLFESNNINPLKEMGVFAIPTQKYYLTE
jgi:hypothetical protein